MLFRNRAALLVLPAAFAALAACGDGLGPPSARLILEGVDQADTVYATLPEPLEVQVLDDGQPASNVEVHITSPTDETSLRMRFRYLGRELDRVVARTDEMGRLSVGLQISGWRAGEAPVRVEVPALALAEEFAIEALAGTPTTVGAVGVVGLGPTNVVPLDDTVQLTAEAQDRWGNAADTDPTCASDDPGLVVSADCEATGVAFGPSEVTFRYDALTASAPIRVIPPGEYLVTSARGLGLVTTDSARSRVLADPGPWEHAWSPDGERIVGVSDGHLHVWTLTDGGVGAPTELVPSFAGSDGEIHPVYSPDGAWIYFTARDVDGPDELWRVRPDGSDPEPLTSDSSPVEGRLAWPSPEGTRVVFVGPSAWPEPPPIRVLNVTTGEIVDTDAQGSYPAWSPTGEWIAYVRGGAIRLLRPDGTLGPDLDVPAPGSRLSWTPDGRYLLYRWDSASPGTGPKEFHVMVEVATGTSVVLPRMFIPISIRFGISEPSWRPAG